MTGPTRRPPTAAESGARGISSPKMKTAVMAGEIKHLDPKQVSTLINAYKSLMTGKSLGSNDENKIGSLDVMESVKAFPIRI